MWNVYAPMFIIKLSPGGILKQITFLSYPYAGRGGPQVCERLRLSIFRHSAQRWKQGCQPYAPTAFDPQEDS
jgi:hypothetical protein